MIKIADSQELKDACYAIRTTVFVEEQGVDKTIEYDQFEDQCTHFLLIEDEPVGTVRYRPYEDGIKIERMAVVKEGRGKGYGKDLIQAAEQHALQSGYHKARLNAQVHAQGFYEQMGYEKQGDIFMEANIPHILMVKNLY